MKTTTIAAFVLPLLSGIPALADQADHLTVPANLPAPLVVQAPEELSFFATGVGVQIYDCKVSGNAFAWVFRAPEAILYKGDGEDDQVIGTHFAGPTWSDGKGTVVGTVAARVNSPDPTAIPWLRLTAASSGHGRFSHVTTVQRLDTIGGVAPASGCDAGHVGDVARVPYSAHYFFYALPDDDQ